MAAGLLEFHLLKVAHRSCQIEKATVNRASDVESIMDAAVATV